MIKQIKIGKSPQTSKELTNNKGCSFNGIPAITGPTISPKDICNNTLQQSKTMGLLSFYLNSFIINNIIITHNSRLRNTKMPKDPK